MTQVAKLMELTFMLGGYFAVFAFVAAIIWSTVARPRSKSEILIWLVAIALNLPFVIVSFQIIAAGSDFVPSQHPLLYLVTFYGVGASGFGWLAGIIFAFSIRALVAMESRQRT
jgi:hypothetical protein